MPHADFVHLRVHSAYSLSEGAIKPDKLASLAAADNMPAVAITDSSNMFGTLEFTQYCTKSGVQPIIGCQLALTRLGFNLPPDPVVALAQTEAGYANLQKLSSLSFLTGDAIKPQITREQLCDFSEGLFLLTGGALGPIGRLLAEGQIDEARAYLAALHAAFPERLAIEIQRHGEPVEQATEPGFLLLAEEFALPLVATNECFFAKREMYEAHDALLCIAEGRVLAEKDRRRVTPEHWFKPAAMMRELFADLPDACDNTLAIAQSCTVMTSTRKPLLPRCPKVREGATEEETLRAMSEEGLRARLDFENIEGEAQKEYWDRLEFELTIIVQMGFPGYFLIVADFIQWAKDHQIPVGPGRGSGAGSLVAWALRITDLNPLRYALLFERFLNPERVSMPDFDIDFCQERRDEVIKYVVREYGAEQVAQIITFGKLQARAAVRDVGRVLGLPYGQVNKVAELIPNNPAKPVTLKEAIEGEPKLQDMRDSDEALARLMEIAQQIEGLYRHASTHAAGVVIGDRELVKLVPLYKDPRSDLLVTQYSMKYVEQVGLVKFDFLGLTTLTIIDRCLKFMRQQGVELDISKIPLDDKKTYDMISRADTAGVFTFETAAFRGALAQMRPDRFEDLVAIQALNRPGPMANIPDYCDRKRGAPWEAPDPSIHHILAETNGIIVYQEQVMQIAQAMAGYTLAGADLLRRAMGKKIRAEMDTQREIFLKGATEKGFTPEKANEIFDLMAKFADYGFNKSHAAAYALVSYQTAYLRANHPVAFIAACMSLSIANTEKVALLRADAMKNGIKVLPPDVNKSGPDFQVELQEDGSYAIRFALGAIKRIGMGAMEELVKARGDTPFKSIDDFAARIDPKTLTRAQIEILAKAGAFECLDQNRQRIFGAAEMIMRTAQTGAAERESGQIGLFGGGEPEKIRLPQGPDWPESERLAFEAEAIGFHISAHPLDMYARALKALDVTPSGAIQRKAENGTARVKLAGTVGAKKERITRTGSRMMWLTLSDMQGSFEVTLFSEVLNRSREMLQEGTALLVSAEAKLDGESLRLTANDIQLLDNAARDAGAGLKIWLDREDAVPSLKALLEREGRGKGQIILLPKTGTPTRPELRLPGGFNVSPRLAQAVKLVAGVELVEDA
ncbi:DNA polymerase III subunit alpha [Acidocella facilis]|uniref:DNA polymerase III subunit alpha n=1 Tax=Acidocella facilis TaxID=525 RepID=UPI00047AB674|nr:DNA polymerase III subunit alpha [Acidocella facilis]